MPEQNQIKRILPWCMSVCVCVCNSERNQINGKERMENKRLMTVVILTAAASFIHVLSWRWSITVQKSKVINVFYWFSLERFFFCKGPGLGKTHSIILSKSMAFSAITYQIEQYSSELQDRPNNEYSYSNSTQLCVWAAFFFIGDLVCLVDSCAKSHKAAKSKPQHKTLIYKRIASSMCRKFQLCDNHNVPKMIQSERNSCFSKHIHTLSHTYERARARSLTHVCRKCRVKTMDDLFVIWIDVLSLNPFCFAPLQKLMQSNLIAG